MLLSISKHMEICFVMLKMLTHFFLHWPDCGCVCRQGVSSCWRPAWHPRAWCCTRCLRLPWSPALRSPTLVKPWPSEHQLVSGRLACSHVVAIFISKRGSMGKMMTSPLTGLGRDLGLDQLDVTRVETGTSPPRALLRCHDEKQRIALLLWNSFFFALEQS